MSTKRSAKLNDTLAIALALDRLMRRIHGDMHPKAAAIDDAKIGPLGGMILITIGEQEPIAIAVLGRRLGRDKAQLTRTIQMLERKGLVARDTCPDDGRVSLLRVTERGRAQIIGFQDALVAVTQALLADLDHSEEQQLLAVLEKVLASGEPDDEN